MKLLNVAANIESVSRADLFERSLGEQVTFDPGQSFMRVVIGLFDQAEFLPLTLIQTRFHTMRKEDKNHNLEQEQSC